MMILKDIFTIFPMKSPEAPKPPKRKPIVEARYMQVVMIEKKLYLLIDYLPFAKRKASITPLNPRNTTNSIYVLKAAIVSGETHFSPYKKMRKIYE
jgi:hypothetical protein